MSNKKKEYLSSLLTWAGEVEENVSKLNSENPELKNWLDELRNWKSMVQEQMESEDEVSDESIYNLQQKSQSLIYLLRDVLENPRAKTNYVAPGNHTLPSLPYEYDALEPYISERIMRLHHNKHHQSYVDGLNKAEKELYINKPDPKLIKHWLREQAFNGSGHYLHTIFWNNMAPDAGGTPPKQLLDQVKKDFGSLKNFKRIFSMAAESVEGVGWAILVWEPRAGRLGIQTLEKHQLFSLSDTIPLLVLDVWEHAYYLQYQTNRADYIDNWWNVVNWDHVQKRFEKAKQLIWPLY